MKRIFCAFLCLLLLISAFGTAVYGNEKEDGIKYTSYNLQLFAAGIALYDISYGATTQTDERYYEVTVKDGQVTAVGGYNNEIPEGGYVIAARGEKNIEKLKSVEAGDYCVIDKSESKVIVLGEDYDVEIVEAHHNKKLDAPSGTALMLADAIRDVREESKYVYDRHSVRRERAPEEIGIHSVRGGTIVGEHEVIFAGTDEVIRISHSAYSRDVFATGAVRAALFAAEAKPGMYSMKEMLAAEKAE